MGRSKVIAVIREASNHKYTQEERLMIGAVVIFLILLVTGYFFITRRKSQLKKELLSRMGNVEHYTDQQGKRTKSEEHPKLKIKRVSWFNPWSEIREVRIRPVSGKNLIVNDILIVLKRIYDEYEWTNLPMQKRNDVFMARKLP